MKNGYDVVGINEAGIEKIKIAIDDYIKAVTKSTTIEATEAEIKRAIKGTAVETQVKTLAAQVDQRIEQVVRSLSDFKNKIDTVKSNYAKYDSSSSTIQNAINNFKS